MRSALRCQATLWWALQQSLKQAPRTFGTAHSTRPVLKWTLQASKGGDARVVEGVHTLAANFEEMASNIAFINPPEERSQEATESRLAELQHKIGQAAELHHCTAPGPAAAHAACQRLVMQVPVSESAPSAIGAHPLLLCPHHQQRRPGVGRRRSPPLSGDRAARRHGRHHRQRGGAHLVAAAADLSDAV